jgi:hypothetical protein
MVENQFSLEKQILVINDINAKIEDEEKLDEVKTLSNTLLNHIEDLGKLEAIKQIDYLKNLFNFSEDYFKKHGDDLMEKIWLLYDDNNFTIDIVQDNLTSNVFFFDLFFLKSTNIKKALESFSTDETGKITSKSIEEIRANINKLNLSDLNPSEQKNFLIDYLVMLVYSKADIKNYYTSLSSFLIQTNSSVMLLYKILALFGLFFLQLDKKENFLDGLLYIIGGVLRDHARSYLKTKGILQENISHHSCSKHHVNILIT